MQQHRIVADGLGSHGGHCNSQLSRAFSEIDAVAGDTITYQRIAWIGLQHFFVEHAGA